MKWILALALVFLVRPVFAQAPESEEVAPIAAENGDREPAQAPTAPHMYMGARDEQKLEVQGSLPQPTRSLDGGANYSNDDDEGPSSSAPTSD